MPRVTLLDVETQVRELARRIDAPDSALPTFGRSEDGARPHIEIDASGRLHYVVVERGQESERLPFIELDALLCRIFEGVTFQLAVDFEFTHRDAAKDCRRVLFSKQMELLRRLSPAWAAREAARHAEILERHPFRDRTG
jgi:hypothetical protein